MLIFCLFFFLASFLRIKNMEELEALGRCGLGRRIASEMFSGRGEEARPHFDSVVFTLLAESRSTNTVRSNLRGRIKRKRMH